MDHTSNGQVITNNLPNTVMNGGDDDVPMDEEEALADRCFDDPTNIAH